MVAVWLIAVGYIQPPGDLPEWARRGGRTTTPGRGERVLCGATLRIEFCSVPDGDRRHRACRAYAPSGSRSPGGPYATTRSSGPARLESRSTRAFGLQPAAPLTLRTEDRAHRFEQTRKLDVTAAMSARTSRR